MAQNSLEQDLAYVAAYLLKTHKSLYGVLNSSHPLQQYARAVYRRHKSSRANPEIVILPGDHTVNAYALGNNILISRGLLDLIEYEEELTYVLKHEESHIIEEHVKKDIQVFSKKGFRVSEYMRVRSAEYIADLMAYLSTAEEQGNPFGAYSLLQKLDCLSTMSNEKISDLDHGPSAYRLIAQRLMTRLVDTPTLSRQLTPVPKHALPVQQAMLCSLVKDEQVLALAAQCGLHAALYNLEALLPEAVECREWLRKIREPEKSSYGRELGVLERAVQILAQRVREGLRSLEVDPCLEPLILCACAGLDYVKDIRDSHFVFRRCVFEEGDCRAFCGWDRKIFQALGLAGMYPEAVAGLAQHCMTAELERAGSFDSKAYLERIKILAHEMDDLFLGDHFATFFDAFAQTGRMELLGDQQAQFDTACRSVTGRGAGKFKITPNVQAVAHFLLNVEGLSHEPFD